MPAHDNGEFGGAKPLPKPLRCLLSIKLVGVELFAFFQCGVSHAAGQVILNHNNHRRLRLVTEMSFGEIRKPNMAAFLKFKVVMFCLLMLIFKRTAKSLANIMDIKFGDQSKLQINLESTEQQAL